MESLKEFASTILLICLLAFGTLFVVNLTSCEYEECHCEDESCIIERKCEPKCECPPKDEVNDEG